MAWVRTSVSLISFGFTIYKFFQYLIQLDKFPPAQSLIGPRRFAIGMIALGVGALAMATVQYRRDIRSLIEGSDEKHHRLTQLFAVAVCLSGAALLAATLLRL
jgi:putative membrane protein